MDEKSAPQTIFYGLVFGSFLGQAPLQTSLREDVKYGTQEAKSWDSNVAGLHSDHRRIELELAPFLAYDCKIKDSEEATVTEKAYCNEPSEDQEAAEKTYCDEKMAKTIAKKEELQDNVGVDKFRTTLVQDIAQLKKEICALEGEFAAITKEQAEMDKICMELHENCIVAKRDLELGLSQVRDEFLCLLQDYCLKCGAPDIPRDNPQVEILKPT